MGNVKKRVPEKEKNHFEIFLFCLLGFLVFYFLIYVSSSFGFSTTGNVILGSQNSEGSVTIRQVIEITDASHLDKNRKEINNIYNELKERDDIWTGEISNGEYVRVKFEEKLNSSKDITIFPGVVSGNPKIEVYEKDKTTKIAEFTSINSNEYNKIFLTNLQSESQDTFDLRVVGGSVEFDHIVDPQFEYEDFEDQNFGNWTEAGGSCVWSIIQGQTAGRSSNTGATQDHTGSATGWFAYVETSSSACVTTDNATLTNNNNFDGDTYALNASFWWHAWGATVGTLYFQANNGSGYQTVWSQTGAFHTAGTAPWNFTEVDLSNWTGTVNLRFHYEQGTGGSFTGDVEIDELSIGGIVSNAAPSTPTNITCGGSNNCNISVDTSVVLNATGSVDPDTDNITYLIGALLDDPSLINNGTDVSLTASGSGGGGISKQGTDVSTDGLNTVLATGVSHTLVAGTDRIIIIATGGEYTDVHSSILVQYGGVTATEITGASISTNPTGLLFYGGLFYVLEADLPADGSNVCSATYTGQTSWVEGSIVCAQYQGVSQEAPEATAEVLWTSGTTITNTISPSTDAWVISATGYGNALSTTWGQSQQEIYDLTDASSGFAVGELRGASGETSLDSTASGTINRGVRVAASFLETAGSGASNETNTTETTYNDVAKNHTFITNITITVEVDSYDPRASVNQSTADPDLWLEIYNGTGWVNIGELGLPNAYTGTGLNTTNANFSLSTTNSGILSGWEDKLNQDFRIKGVYMDNNITLGDEINYTDVWTTIQGTGWQEIGNHTNNGTAFTWDTSSLSEQTGINLRARAIDIDGSNTYSNYFTKNSILNISHGPGDTTAPTYSNPSVNDSTPNPADTVRHNINWTDDTALSFAKLEINSTGANCNTSANITNTTLSGTSSWANLSWQVPNACEGKIIGWRQYANDSSDNWNVTSLQTYNVQNVNPVVSFGSNPVDNYNSSSQSVTFDLKVSDNLAVNGLQLYGNWTGSWTANQTNASPINNTYWNITVSGIPEGKYVWAVWGNDTLGNSAFSTSNRTLTVDTTAPSITLPFYTNATIRTNTDTLTVNISVSDTTTVPSTCKIEANGTNTTIVVSSGWCNTTTIPLTNLADGNHTINVYANDSANNFGLNNSYVVSVDSTSPQIQFTAGTENNGTSKIQNWIFANVSLTETNLKNITYKLFNSSGSVNETTYSTAVTSINWTGLLDTNVQYQYNVSSYDTANNFNITETRYITLTPNQAPAVTIFYPTNTSYNSEISQLNFTATDDTTLDYCWYSLNGGTSNSTPDASCANITGLTATEGQNTWIVYANDSAGLESSDSVNFFKDTILPVFSGYTQNPSTPNEDQNFQANVTITEINLDTVIFEFNGTVNYTVTTSNGGEFFFTIASGNYTAHDAISYYWYANDSAGNLNRSEQQSFTVANQQPAVSAPSINDTIPETNDLISCNGGTFSDSDAEDSEQNRYFLWYDNNVEISGQTAQTLDLSVSGLDKGDVILCSVRVYDGFDNSSFVNSSNTATIQNSAPVITNPLTSINWNANGSTFTYDYDYTDADGDSVTWFDNTTLFDINSTGFISDTPTEAEVGSYAIRISASDGTTNATDDFTYTINDVTNPIISIVYPANTSYIVNVSQLNFTYTETNPEKCWYSTDSGSTNSTPNECTSNFTDVISVEGSNTWIVYINDTSGNEDSDTIVFNKDTAYPSVTINTPLNQTYNTNSITFNVTAIDGGGISSCLYSLTSGSVNYSMTNSAGNYWTATNSSMTQGSHTVNYYCNDSLGNLNNTEQITFFIDSINPEITSLTESPSDPTTYSSGQSYEFNATVTDTNLDSVVIEFNGTNYTPSNLQGDIYNLTISGLTAGTYSYYWYANDTVGNSNYTGTQTYTINQNTEACNVLFNDTSPVTYGEAFIVYSDCTSPFTLYRNGTSISNASVQNLAASTYNFTVIRTDNANYSNVYDEETFSIQKTSGDATLLINGSTSNQTGSYGTQTNASASTSYGSVTLYRNGTDVSSQNNALVTLAAGYYNYTAVSSGDENHTTASTESLFVDISKTASEVDLNLNNTDGNVTIVQDSIIPLNVSIITGDSGATLKLYNNGTLINQGISSIGNFTTFSSIGIFNITGVYNESENYTASIETWYVNVTETPDVTNPSISSLTESPSDPATYSLSNIYIFNSTITDNRNLDTVLIEFDGINYTPSNLAGNIYNLTLRNLSAGTYNYYWYANDSYGNVNQTSGTYTINQASPSLTLEITPSLSETYGTETTATGSNCPSQITCNLYRDGSSVSNPDTETLTIGTYNYTYNTSGNTNYTSYTNTTNLTISQNTEACNVLFNDTSPVTYGEAFIVYSDCTSPFTLYRNGTSISNASVQNLAASTYNFTVIRTDNANYSNVYDEETFSINKKIGSIFTYINNSRANKTIEQFTEIYLNGTLETGTGSIKLYNNSTLINQGNSPLSNFTNFTNTGLHNITTTYSGNENYTAVLETFYVNVTPIDIIPPHINITNPLNTSYNSVQTQLNYTAEDNIGLESCWYSLDNGATNTTTTCGQNVSGLSSNEGSNKWNIYANDSRGNQNSSSVTFFVDSINPSISFASGTETSSSNLTRNYIQVNVTSSDANLDTITIRLYNSSGSLIRTNISNSSPHFINYTGLTSGTYYFNATANDTVGNENSTDTKNISLVKPTITITAPENKTYITSKNLKLNYTSENEVFVWYNVDSGSNTTIANNATFNTSSGQHTLYLYANNSNGISSGSIVFTVDITFIVHYDKYKDNGSSTDFNSSSYEDLQNLSGIVLENTNYGKIIFNEAINVTADAKYTDSEINLDDNTNISSNFISINSTALPNFNKSATLYLYNLTFSNPRILRNGAVCPSAICTKQSYSQDTGTLIFNVTQFSNYSAEETPVTASAASGGGEKKITYECTENSECSVPDGEVCFENKCVKLFDVKILEFESPAKLNDFFKFVYFLKGVGNINNDVQIDFWIEDSQGKKITSGSDVIYFGSSEEKTEGTKIFLPKNLESGVYQFFIRVSYGDYSAISHRTIEIEAKNGIADIKTAEKFQIPTSLIITIIIIALLLSGGRWERKRRNFGYKTELNLGNLLKTSSVKETNLSEDFLGSLKRILPRKIKTIKQRKSPEKIQTAKTTEKQAEVKAQEIQKPEIKPEKQAVKPENQEKKEIKQNEKTEEDLYNILDNLEEDKT